MKSATYKRYTNKFNDPRSRNLDKIAENEIVCTFKGDPASAKQLADVINKDNLYERKVTAEEIKALVASRFNNLFNVGDKICTVSSRMPEKLRERIL